MNGAGFPAPGMVNKQPCIFTEQPVQQLFMHMGAQRHIPHGEHAVSLQLPGITVPHTPEIRQGAVIPQGLTESHFIQMGNAHPMRIRRDMLGYDIHGHLAKKQISSDACRGCNACFRQHVQNDLHGKIMGGKPAGRQVAGHVHEDLINGVDHHILRGNVSHVNGINAGTVVHVPCHLGRCNEEIHPQCGIGLQISESVGTAGEFSTWGNRLTLGIHVPHFLLYLKQPWAAGNPQTFQGRGDSQANGFVRAAFVRYHQVGVQRIKPPFPALHRGIEGLQVNGDVSAFPHPLRLLSAKHNE